MSGSDEDEEVEENESIQSDFDIALENLLKHFIKYNLTYECLENTAKLMNAMPGATVKLPTSKRVIIKAFLSLSSFKKQYHIYCEQCEIYNKCLPKKCDKWRCMNCSSELKIGETNHFVYIKLEEQLKKVLSEYGDIIANFKSEIDSDINRDIKDVHSGALMKVVRNKTNMLSIMINSDGLSLKKSGNNSVWPLQIICNFLPPELRYRTENIITVAFYYNHSKPDMLKFLVPFCEEMEILESKGFVFENQVFRVAITHAVFDLPAKAAFQQTMQYNGYFGCGYCVHEGEKTIVGVRYTTSKENIKYREHKTFVSVMQEIWQNPNNNIAKYGIKGISPAISFEYFDMVKSFCLDYMHSVCIGVSKTCNKFWFNPSKKHASYIGKKKKDLLNHRIRSIKPCRFISRLPRSIDLRNLFKASEFRNNLLFFSPVCLLGLLQKKYLDHFNLLSSSIYVLLSTNISEQGIAEAENNLNLFVNQYEQLYGKESMTMNVHLLTHITYCVKNLGPLWAQSMFSFESNNATFSRYVRGHTDIISQISTKYILDKSITKKRHSNSLDKSECLEYRKIISLTEGEVYALCAENIAFKNNMAVPVYCVYTNNDDRYTSIRYSRAKKTIDYFVVMKNKLLGKVKYYFRFETLNYMVVEEFEYGEQHVNHIYEVKPKLVELVCLAGEIDKKMIYINFHNKHYITERPNIFESD